jgi:hypothetical protein
MFHQRCHQSIAGMFWITHWRCSGVSGIEQPRADSTPWNASFASYPSRTRTDTASTEERPILARQCTARGRPSLTISASRSTLRKKSPASDGTERSGMGRFTNLIATASQSSDSGSKPSSIGSSFVNMETRTSIPTVDICAHFVTKPVATARTSDDGDAIRSGGIEGVDRCFHAGYIRDVENRP